jgi:hypothetical protein
MLPFFVAYNAGKNVSVKHYMSFKILPMEILDIGLESVSGRVKTG